MTINVELLNHTPNPERAVATAARLCYAPVGASELMETMPDKKVYSVLKTILESGHYSTLEHASYTFAIEGISRACTHQLVRHRMASFNQQSQRYVKFDDGFDYIEPESIANDPVTHQAFVDAMIACTNAYETIRNVVGDDGKPVIKAEDARFVLPNAAETKIVVTMNIRELLHFFELRCCNRAQWEIRELAHKMLELVKPTAPYIFAEAGAPCVSKSCPEGKMTCGHPYAKTSRENTLELL